MRSWRKEGDDGELTNAGSDLSAECWPVDPAALKEKSDTTGITSAAFRHHFLTLLSSGS